MALPANTPTFPLSAFIQPIEHGGEVLNHKVLPVLWEANIVIGRDVMTRNQFMLFGSDTLQKIANREDVESRLLVIKLDQETHELEMAIALMKTQKGNSKNWPIPYPMKK